MSVISSLAYRIIQDLEKKNRNFCSTDYDSCLDYLSNILNFKILEYSESFNSWQIPPKWDLREGKIFYHNRCIYEVDHPLKIIGLSLPFSGLVNKNELQKHLHYDHRYPEAIPYHFRQFYRPWERDWGFCVPQTFYNKLEEGEYSIHIETDEAPGTLKVAEYTHKGSLSETFTFVAHLDHPGMANDDLAGVAVGVELFKKISSMKTRFTYKLILLPEIIGSEFYLGKTVGQNHTLLGSIFLEMLGSKTPLALQKSFRCSNKIESSLRKVLDEQGISYTEGPFKSIICNDEAVWESHQISMCSLSRFPYPEYHSSRDNLSIINPQSLKESIDVLFDTVQLLEKQTLIEKTFQGTPCVSHPSLNLYVDPGQRAFGTHQNESIQQLRLLMDLIPLQNRHFFLDDILRETELSQAEVIDYLSLWEEKGLLKLKTAPLKEVSV